MTKSGRGLLCAALLGVGACGPTGGPEATADRSYAEGRYQQALAGYAPLVEAQPSPRLWAKVGATALHLGQLREAAAAYLALAQSGPERSDEAIDGLEQVIVSAERRRDNVALEEAVGALRSISPSYPLGRHALNLVELADGPVAPSDFAAALAAATEARIVDSLLVRQAAALAADGECAGAVPLFQAVGRRAGRSGSAVAEAGLVDCFFRLGTALLPSAPDSAESWFRNAAGLDPTTPLGRAAMIGLGDARARQGDLVGAALAYQTVLSSGDRTDSLSGVAGAKLNALVSADVPDSLSTGMP